MRIANGVFRTGNDYLCLNRGESGLTFTEKYCTDHIYPNFKI